MPSPQRRGPPVRMPPPLPQQGLGLIDPVADGAGFGGGPTEKGRGILGPTHAEQGQPLVPVIVGQGPPGADPFVEFYTLFHQ